MKNILTASELKKEFDLMGEKESKELNVTIEDLINLKKESPQLHWTLIDGSMFRIEKLEMSAQQKVFAMCLQYATFGDKVEIDSSLPDSTVKRYIKKWNLENNGKLWMCNDSGLRYICYKLPKKKSIKEMLYEVFSTVKSEPVVIKCNHFSAKTYVSMYNSQFNTQLSVRTKKGVVEVYDKSNQTTPIDAIKELIHNRGDQLKLNVNDVNIQSVRTLLSGTGYSVSASYTTGIVLIRKREIVDKENDRLKYLHALNEAEKLRFAFEQKYGHPPIDLDEVIE